MTQEQFEREKRYQIALSIAASLLKNKIIHVDEYRKIETRFREKFCPPLGDFLFEQAFPLCFLSDNTDR